MRPFLGIFLIFLNIHLLNGRSLGEMKICPDDSVYVEIRDICLLAKDLAAPQSYGETYCQALGGHLVSIQSGFENAIYNGYKESNITSDKAYIGSMRDGNGTWFWTDGTPWKFMKWDQDKKDVGDCAYMTETGFWNQTDCSQSFPFLCSLPKIDPNCTETTVNAISCPKGTKYSAELGTCFHDDSNLVPFDLAEDLCQAWKGHLFSIHGEEEDAYLLGSSLAMPGDKFYIGSRKNGNYSWLDGTPMDYLNWEIGEPQLECVVFDKNTMKWSTVDCSTRLPFICNVPPIFDEGCTTGSTSSMSTTTPITTKMITTRLATTRMITTKPPTSTTTMTTKEPRTTALPRSTTTPPFSMPTDMPPLDCGFADAQKLYNCYQGWQYFPETAYSYKIGFDTPFFEAEAECEKEGGHLASIHSINEHKFIGNLCCPGMCDERSASGWLAAYLIGAESLNGEWKWTDGTPYDFSMPICTNVTEDSVLWINHVDCGYGCAWDSTPFWYSTTPYYVCKRFGR